MIPPPSTQKWPRRGSRLPGSSDWVPCQANLTQLALPTMLRETTAAEVRSLRERGPDLLHSERQRRDGFEKRLAERWQEGMELAELLRGVALEAGIEAHGHYQPVGDDFIYYCLVRLHARACLISSEILSLLRSWPRLWGARTLALPARGHCDCELPEGLGIRTFPVGTSFTRRSNRSEPLKTTSGMQENSAPSQSTGNLSLR